MARSCKSKRVFLCVFASFNVSFLFRYITQESHKLEVALKPPPAVTNAVSWRTEGVKYRKNEVFLDVIESVDLLAGASGNVLRSEIVGCIKMRVYLSGMPELRLGLNDKARNIETLILGVRKINVYFPGLVRVDRQGQVQVR